MGPHGGNAWFDTFPKFALPHYQVGIRLGDWSLEGFENPVLPWSSIDNRPYLRCLHGYGLCLWRLGRSAEAEEVIERQLWLNPDDNQGARFILEAVRSRTEWTPNGEV